MQGLSSIGPLARYARCVGGGQPIGAAAGIGSHRGAIAVPPSAQQTRARMRIRLRFSPSSRHPGARPVRRGALLLLTCALAACGGKSPDQKAQDAVEAVRSWIAAMRLAGSAWLGGKVPAAYARRTFETAGETLATEMETLRQDGVPPVLRADLGRLHAPARSARQLADAVERGDSTAVRQELGALAVQDAGLEALMRRLPGTGR
jgi:hypothetical protein